MKNKILFGLCLTFACFLTSNSAYSQEIRVSKQCQELINNSNFKDIATKKGIDISKNPAEICELFNLFSLFGDLKSQLEDESNESEKIALGKEKQDTISEILNIKPNTKPPSITSFFKTNENSVLDRSVRSPGSAIELNASTSNNNALLRVGLLDKSSSIPKFDKSGNIESETAKQTTLDLTASSPIDSAENVTDIATLDGLVNSTRIAFRFNQFFLSGLIDPALPTNKELLNNVSKICNLVGIDIFEVDPDPLKNKACNDPAVRTGLEDPALGLTREQQDKIFKVFKESFFKSNSWNFGYSLEGSVGFENFEFTNAETQEQEDESRVPWSVGASFNFNPPTDFPLLVTFGVEYQEAFFPSATQTVCPPSDGINSVTCSTGVFGEPISSERLLLSLDGRFRVLDTGVSLRVTHDLENNATGIDLPIFLIPDREGNLNGGVRLGWTSVEDDNDFSVGLFVGSSFSLF